MKESDYILTVIKDNTVPLADVPHSNTYFGWAVAGIVIITMVLLGVLYGTWYREHMRRIRHLGADLATYKAEETEMMSSLSIFHPRTVIEMEKELEQQLAGYYVMESTEI